MNKFFGETSPTPPLQVCIQSMRAESYNALRQCAEATVQGFRQFWYNPDHTPEELLQELGPLAAGVFAQHARTVQYLLQSGVEIAEADYTPPRQFTTNEDGTIELV